MDMTLLVSVKQNPEHLSLSLVASAHSLIVLSLWKHTLESLDNSGQSGIRRCLGQPPVQRRHSYKVRPGCSGFYPVGSWKPPRM